MAPAPAARVHGPLGVRGPRRAAADAQRQGRPPGPARPRPRPARRGCRLRPAARADRGGPGRDLGRAARRRPRRRARQLLRARRPLAHGHPAPGRIRDLFDVEAPLKDFIEEPTLARLARLRRAGPGRRRRAARLPRSGRSTAQGPLPASFAQQRLWFLDQLEPGSAAYNIPAAVRLDGRSTSTPSAARPQRGRPPTRGPAHHLRRRGRRSRARSSPTRLELPWPSRISRGLPEDERERAALERIREEAARPFDLARGPLVRAALIRLGERRAHRPW